MPRPRKCAICGRVIGDNEEVIPYKNKMAHKWCFDGVVNYVETGKEKNRKATEKAKIQREKEKKQSPPPALKTTKRVSEEEFQEKQSVFTFIEKLTGEPPKVKHYHILESYIEKYHFTYPGILIALQYFFIDKGNSVADDNFLGILPYIYEEAQKADEAIKKTQAVNEEILSKMDVNDLYPTEKVYVKPKPKARQELTDISEIKIDNERIGRQKSHLPSFGRSYGPPRIR